MSSNPKRPETLVLLHGFTQTGRSWDRVVDSLPAQRYRALAPDLRGHGDAAALRPATIDACIADLAAIDAATFTLAGYSMGGRIALAFAVAHPQRVEKLVLVSTTAGIEDQSRRAERRLADAELADALEREGLEPFIARWAAQPLFAGQPPEVRAAAHRDRLRNDAAGLAAALRGMGTGAMPPLWGELARLAMPVVILAGERDERYVETATLLAAELPAARVEIVAGAGHALTLEAPAAVAAAIVDG